MSDADARAWHGRTARLTANEAMFGGIHCDKPAYGTRTVAKDSFLAADFHLPPGSIEPLASLEQFTLLEVRCGGERWAAPGGRLIEIDATHALAPWDGVFFQLRRDQDFRAAGQEPFWRLEIAKGKEIRFTQVGKVDAVTPVPEPVTNRESGARSYHAVTEANDLRVIIEPTPCTDAMSGKPFETTVTITLNGQTYRGCGGPLE